ncbi:hypothetical protein [Guggenheimella bovis]
MKITRVILKSIYLLLSSPFEIISYKMKKKRFENAFLQSLQDEGIPLEVQREFKNRLDESTSIQSILGDIRRLTS